MSSSSSSSDQQHLESSIRAAAGAIAQGTTAREGVEHVANVARAKRFAIPGLLVWLLSAPLDVVATRDMARGHLGDMLLVTASGAVAIVLAFARMSLRPPSPWGWRFSMTNTFAYLNVAFGLMGAMSGGLTSPYSGGALVCLASFGIVVTLRWRDGLFWCLPVALAYPATVLACALFMPEIARQLHDPRALVSLQFDIANMLSLYALVVAAGHVQWSLRNQVFEARNLGRYKLKKKIGAGGMGEVWVAYHQGLKRDVAVKILVRDEGTAEQAARAFTRFEREVRATADLTHPNTVRVFDYGVTDDGLCYYVMELLSGESLADLATHEAPLAPARALHLVGQAARALAEAHTRGIVHRDIKPENIVVTNAGGERDFVKVLDFGIAKLTSARDEETALTRAGSMIGTPKWMAPEAFMGKEVEAPADVYGLGAILYLLLVGKAPMRGETIGELAEEHTRATPVSIPSSVPKDIASVIERCLKRAPAERFADAGALAEALAACAPTDAKAVTERPNVIDAYGVTVVGNK
jgi:serine/threonine-protein kinase